MWYAGHWYTGHWGAGHWFSGAAAGAVISSDLSDGSKKSKRKKIRRKVEPVAHSQTETPSRTFEEFTAPLPPLSDNLDEQLRLLNILTDLKSAIEADEQAKVAAEMERARAFGEHQARLQIEDLMHQIQSEDEAEARAAFIDELIQQTEDEVLLALAL